MFNGVSIEIFIECAYPSDSQYLAVRDAVFASLGVSQIVIQINVRIGRF